MVDKLAEHPEQINLSPYAYTGNNPISRIDPDGNCWPCIVAAFELAAEAFTTTEVVSAGVAISATALTMNNINNYSRNRDYAVQDNTRVQPRPNIVKTEEKSQTKNEKLRETAKTGQEAHRQEQKKLKEEGAEIEVPMQLEDGTKVRKDAVRPDGTTVIIKPNTPSGQKSAEKRDELMKKKWPYNRIEVLRS